MCLHTQSKINKMTSLIGEALKDVGMSLQMRGPADSRAPPLAALNNSPPVDTPALIDG